ncbi:hypothetical protein ASG89_10155 [Paenibacillus sp. Soil766]|uniref:hypothetical protein n=1 Tax=Paenibacillus sp. Soil766 TaxID=1736404 RepID=UPI00070C7DEE|nr:hypothetical protein [Paenibacillus sp. Soil766]KRE86370.1 hypothetical protein ASG89_10155 [Paenibacillus sp. Soil766]
MEKDKKIHYRIAAFTLIFLFSIFFYFNFNQSKIIDNSTVPTEHIGEIVSGTVIEQTINLPRNNLKGIQINFATFERVNTSELNIEFIVENRIIERKVINTSELVDNSFENILFLDTLTKSKSKDLIIKISSVDGKPGNAVTIWKNMKLLNHGDKLTINSKDINGSINYKLVFGSTNWLKVLLNFVLFLSLICILFRNNILEKYYKIIKANSKEILFFILLFIVGFLFLFLRNSDPFLNPILYAEEGVWTSYLLEKDFIEVGLNARDDFPVMGLIILMKIGLVISKLVFGLDLSYLPIIYGIISLTFITFVALTGFYIMKKISIKSAVITYFFVIFVPLGGDGNEVLGRILNLGFLFPVATVFLLIARFHIKNRYIKILIDIFNIISCLTLPVSFVIVGTYIILNIFLNKKKINLKKTLLDLMLPIVTCLLFVIMVPSFLHSKGGSEGLSTNLSHLIEFSIGRIFIYPLASVAWTKFTDFKVLIIFLIYIILLIGAVIISYSNKRHLLSILLIFLSTFIYWIGLVIPRIGFTSIFNGYQSTFPDRYFYGINILVVVLLTLVLDEIGNHFKKGFVISCFACLLLFSVFNTSHLIELNKPVMSWNERGVLKNNIQMAYNENKDDKKSDKVLIKIYPEGWTINLPIKYVLATIK